MKTHLISYLALGVALSCSAPVRATQAQDPPAKADEASSADRQNASVAEIITDENAPSSGTAGSGEKASDIVVTGSRIRGVAPVGSTVIGITREDVIATSAVSTSDIFKN